MTTKLTGTEAYNLLLKEIEAVDPEASAFLKKHGRKIHNFKKAPYLSSCFIWNDSPQGYDYWYKIADKIPHGWRPLYEESP